MDKCWLQGGLGDALHALSCAAGYNIRWLMRAISCLGLKGLFCALSILAPWGRRMLIALSTRLGASRSGELHPVRAEMACARGLLAAGG